MSKYRKNAGPHDYTDADMDGKVVPLAQVASLEDGLRTAIPFKETTLALEDVRVLELRSLMRRGAEGAEEAVLSAGYMGGDSTFAIRVWIALGIVSYVYGVVWLYWTFQSEVLTRGQFACDVFWYTTYIIMGPLPILRGWLRRYHYHGDCGCCRRC